MIVHLEEWQDDKEYERLGLDRQYEEILGKKIVKYTLPIKPGRQNALIIEMATKSFKQNEIGYNAAEELNKKILNYKETD